MRPSPRLLAAALTALLSLALISGDADAAKKRSRKPAEPSTEETKPVVPAGPTRRAFVVGVRNYRDPGIEQLTLATNDARAVAAGLKQVNFDEKNIKIEEDPPSKAAFMSDLLKFVNTIQKGDTVFFYFSGHGYGGRTDSGEPQDFLLFGDVHSQYEFARSKATGAEKSSPQLLAARAQSQDVIADYATNEIPDHGISEKAILEQIKAKEPSVAIIVIDACRNFLTSDAKGIGRYKAGTTMTLTSDAPSGFMIIYAASHGQQSIEKLGANDLAKNSLFTSVFLDYMGKPGLDLTHLAKRVQDKVSQIAKAAGFNQDPDYVDNIHNGDFYFIEFDRRRPLPARRQFLRLRRRRHARDPREAAPRSPRTAPAIFRQVPDCARGAAVARRARPRHHGQGRRRRGRAGALGQCLRPPRGIRRRPGAAA